MEYYIKVGDSEFVSEFYYLMVWGAGSNEMVVIPSYWMHFYDINYFRVQLYGEERCRWFAGEHRLNDTVVKGVLIPLIHELVGDEAEHKYY